MVIPTSRMPSHSIHLTHGTRRSYSEILFTLPLKVHLLSRNNLASTMTRISLYPVLSLISFASVAYRIHLIKFVFNRFYKLFTYYYIKDCSVLPIISSCVFLESTLKKALYPATRTIKSLWFSGCFCASIKVSLETMLYCT